MDSCLSRQVNIIANCRFSHKGCFRICFGYVYFWPLKPSRRTTAEQIIKTCYVGSVSLHLYVKVRAVMYIYVSVMCVLALFDMWENKSSLHVNRFFNSSHVCRMLCTVDNVWWLLNSDYARRCGLEGNRLTQPSIPPGSVYEYQFRLGRQRQVWFIALADERGVCR